MQGVRVQREQGDQVQVGGAQLAAAFFISSQSAPTSQPLFQHDAMAFSIGAARHVAALRYFGVALFQR
jgi:hypothetical protein